MAPKNTFTNVPTYPTNWPPRPKSQADLQVWIAQTSRQLKTWLEETRNQVHRDTDTATLNAIAAINAEGEELRTKLESSSDVQTGTIWNRQDAASMSDSLNKLRLRSKKLHASRRTWLHHIRRTAADVAWEDFLYYQNVWNRKDFNTDQEFFVTKQERRYREWEQAQEAKKSRTRSSKRRQPKRNEGVSGPKKETELWQPKDGAIQMTFEEIKDVLTRLHTQWLGHVMTVFKEFRLGYRKETPQAIAPDDAHRYSQPSRGTISRKTDSYRARHDHIEKRFPRKKRKEALRSSGEEGPTPEVEEAHTKDARHVIEANNEDTMEDIKWHLDEDAVQASKIEKEDRFQHRFQNGVGYWHGRNETQLAQDTRRLVPANHQIYHASLAKSHDWPTSFDRDQEPDKVAQVSRHKEYLYESDADMNGLIEMEKEARKDDTGRVRQVEPKARYKQVQVRETEKVVDVVEHDFNEDGVIKWQDDKGNWIGKHTQRKSEPTMWTWELEEGQRVPLPPRFNFRRRFSVRMENNPDKMPGQKARHEEGGKMDELSDDDGDFEHEKTNKHYTLSGNAHPDQIASAPRGPSDNLSGSDEEDDHDGDLFRQSYQEGSSVVYRNRR
ncbi:hypothetical protein ACEQ8H_007922 [Pleosporales sp. CAS-2024a]